MAYKADVEKSEPGVFVVKTNAPPVVINEIAEFIYTQWVKFATGLTALDGRLLLNPTGKYERSISMNKISEREVAIIADPTKAPEANYLEFGHKAYDMKEKFRGRVFPIHRAGGIPFQKGVRVPGYYATFTSRSNDFTGWAEVGEKGWVIPEMKAYHPAMTLAYLAEKKLRSYS